MTRRLLAVISTLGAVAGGCSSPSSEGPAPAIPEAVQRAFDDSCAEAECHDASSQAGGLSLEPADSLAIIGGPSSQSELPLVEVGSLAGSYLAIKLLPADQLPSGAVRHRDPMPLGGYEGNDVDNVNTILSWIAGYGPDGAGTGPGGTGGTQGTGSGSGSADSEGSTGTSGPGPDTAPDDSDDGGPSVPRCSVAGVTAGVVTDPLDKGDEAGRFPQVVGEALEANCGCHTLADRELNTELPFLLAPAGTLFLEHADMARPAGGTSLGLLMEDAVFGTFSMPPGTCSAMPANDTAVLLKWFEDGLPDGARFVPP